MGKPEFTCKEFAFRAHIQPQDTCLPEKGAQTPKRDPLGASSPYTQIVTHRGRGLPPPKRARFPRGEDLVGGDIQ